MSFFSNMNKSNRYATKVITYMSVKITNLQFIYTKNNMKPNSFYKRNQLIKSILFAMLFISYGNLSSLKAQPLSGTYTIPGSYASIQAAVAALNTNGVGAGGAVFNITAGYTEILTSTIALTATGTLANPITFQKSGVGANPLITAYVGTMLASSVTIIDGMWSFTGSDYVTIDGVDLLDPVTNNTPTTNMEYGYGFFRATDIDGANNNTIKNCVITLNRDNAVAAGGPRWAGSVAIAVMACTPSAVGTQLTQTSIAGANSNNKFYSNTIQNCNGGIALGGAAIPSPHAIADLNNDVGGNSLVTGNTIINFGGGIGATSACMAVWASNQWGFNISYNTINNNNGSGINHPATNRGIFAAANSVGASANINFNKVSIAAGTSISAITWCIDVEMAQSGANGNIINVNNNQLLNCRQNTALNTVPFTGIWLNSAATTVNCNNNYIYGFAYDGSGISQCILSQLAGVGTLNINNNIIDSTVFGGTGVGTHHNIGITAAPTLLANMNGNTVTRTYLNTTGTGAKTIYGIHISAATPTININDNLVDSISRNGASGGTTIGIYHTGGTNGTTTVNVRRNIVRNMSISGTGATSILYGIQVSTGTIICDSNTVFNLSCLKISGTSALYGIYDISSPNNENYNYNTIYNLTHNGTGILYGMYMNTTTGVRTVSYNNIYNLIGNNTVAGIFQTTSVPRIFNNKIYDLTSNNNAATIISGISVTTSSSGTAQIYNNLISRLFAPLSNGGTTATVRGISLTTTSTTTTIGIYNNTILLNAVSTGTNFSTTGIFHTFSTTATSASLDLRNNIIVNNSTPNGTGITSALNRSAATNLNNFSTNSNRNLFYAGTPSPNQVIYYDGTNIDQTIAAYKTRVTPRDTLSVTENVNFINTINGASSFFLRVDTTIATEIESAGRTIAGVTTLDFANTLRGGNIGYFGTGGAPDLGAYEGNYIGMPANQMAFDSANADQITGAVPIGGVNSRILRLRLYSTNASNALQVTSFKLSTTVSIPTSNIINAKIYYTGADGNFNSTTLFGTAVAPNGVFYITGNIRLALGINNFWVTYDVSPSATLGVLDASVDSVVLSGSNYGFINTDPIGNRPLQAPLSGTYNIGAGQIYTTITSALLDLNLVGMSAPVTLSLINSTYNTTTGEIFPLVFTNFTGLNSINTLTIQPSMGVAVRIESNNTTATIDLNGVSNVIIDGRQGGTGGFISGNNLTIANTGTTAPAVRFINDADTNRIIYTDLKARNLTTISVPGGGVVNFGVTNGTNGNDFNTIKFCDIHEDTIGSNPLIAISSIGLATTLATNNDNNIIDSNNIYNFHHPLLASAAIYVGANNNSWTINGNRFYQTATNTVTGTQTLRVLWITPNTANLTSASGFIITNNFIGGSAATGTGTYALTGTTAYSFNGMDISVGYGTPTSIQNNTITNFHQTVASTLSTSFVGINLANGNVNVGTTMGNIIGSRTTNGAITYTTTVAGGGVIAYRTSGGTNNTFNFSNNIVSGINLGSAFGSEFFGFAFGGGTNVNATNNMVGDTTLPNSIFHFITPGTNQPRIVGFILNPTAGANVYNVSNNVVANFNINHANAAVKGVFFSATSTTASTYTASGNLIKNLFTSSRNVNVGGTSALIGIQVGNLTATNSSNFVNNNTIHSLITNSISGGVYNTGIQFNGPASGSSIIRGNFIHSQSTGVANDTAFIIGIELLNGNAAVLNNIVRLGIDSNGTSIPCSPRLFGLVKSGTSASNTNNIYFNTIYIGGSSPTIFGDTNRTFAFVRTGAGVDDVDNNIFYNVRTNTSLIPSKHFAVSLLNNTFLTMNYNLLKGDSIGLFNNTPQFSLSNWKGASGVDANSISGSLNFVNSSGNSNLLDLHTNASIATPIEASGIAVSGTGTDVDFDGQARSTLTPVDMGADAGNFIPSDLAPPTITYTALSNTLLTTNRTLTATITDVSGVYLTGALTPRVYFKKFASGAWNSAAGTLVSGNQTNSTWDFVISSVAIGGLISDDSVYYFIVAQDSTLNSNIGSFPAGVAGTSVNLINTYPNGFGYKIIPTISGPFNVGVGQTFTTLTGANGIFSYINSAVISGDITLNIVSDIFEPGTHGLNETVETGAGGYNIKIVPDAATVRNITGSFATANSGLIRLNGADRVVIDGAFGGSGKYLRIMNRLQGAVTLLLQNDADRDSIRNCIIEGVANVFGTITIGGSTKIGGTGNDSNIVSNCIIRDTLGTLLSGNIPNTAISNSGTTGLENDNNAIIGNEIFNFGFNAMNLNATGMGNNWVINNNAIYQLRTVANVLNIIFVQGGVGHTINNNNIGGSAPDRSGSALSTSSGSTAEGISAIRLALGTGTATNVNGNTISNMGVTTITGGIANIIWVTAGSANIENNLLGGGMMPYDTIRNGYDNGIINIASSTGTVLVNNNIISNITYYKAGGDRTSGITASAGTHVITNNTIRNIRHNGTGTAYNFLGMGIFLSGGTGHTVIRNTVSNISNTNTGATAFTSVGINSLAASSTIARNRVYNIFAVGTGTGANSPVVSGIYSAGADANIQNNQVSLGDSTILEARVYGIHDAGTGNINIINNSVFINGIMSGGANNSFGIYRVSTSTINAMNNIVYNKRITNGTGFSFGMGSVNAVTSANLNYNLMIVADTSRLVQLGGVAQGWSALNTLYTTTYNTNWATTTAQVQPQDLFIDTLVGNLGIVTTSPAAWYANGKGKRVANISGDFSNASGVRSTTITGGATDIGSVEFTPTSMPPIAFADKAPAANDSTQFFFGSRMIAKAVWGSAGSLPSTVDARYYSGVNPSNTNVGTTFMNTYWDMQVTGGSAYSYNLILMQDSAVLGTVASVPNLAIAQYLGTGNNWSLDTPGLVSNVTGLMGTSNKSSFGIFSGTNSLSNPLPVKLLSLQAVAKNNDVLVSWITASEVNNKGFEVESSTDAVNFKFVGFVKGAGNSQSAKNYNLTDVNAINNNAGNVIYYRLKQLDVNGKYSYSNIVAVNKNVTAHDVVSVYPNPFNSTYQLVFTTIADEDALIETVDIQGKVLHSKNVALTNGINKVMMNESADLKAGVYFVRVTLNNKVIVQKLVKN